MAAKMATKRTTKVTAKKSEDTEVDYSLNDLLLRGRVSAPAIEKELPSGDKVVEFRLIVTRIERGGVDTLDIAAWSSKMRRSALSLKEGEWIEITEAGFSHDPTGKADRLDRFMGVEDGQFFLSHGGFIEGFTPFGQKFPRPATGKPPGDLDFLK